MQRPRPSAAIAAILAMLLPMAAGADTFVYVAASKDGVIDSYRMNEETGQLTAMPKVEIGIGVGPMALHPQGSHLYAAVRTQPFRVTTFAIAPEDGTLTTAAVAALPENFAYISVDANARMLLGASYGGNKIGVLPVAEGGVVTAGTRQLMPAGRNAHAVFADDAGRFAYSTALGTDEVIVYRIEEGDLLTPASSFSTGKGSGPRHMALSPDGTQIYVLTELSGEVLRFDLDPETGGMTEAQRISIVPGDAMLQPGLAPGAEKDDVPRIWAADLAVTPNGRFIYATERTTSQITLLSVEQEGELQVAGTYSTERQPRDIAIDPAGRFLVASGELSDHVGVFSINGDSGQLTDIGRYPVGMGANWVEIVRLRD